MFWIRDKDGQHVRKGKTNPEERLKKILTKSELTRSRSALFIKEQRSAAKRKRNIRENCHRHTGKTTAEDKKCKTRERRQAGGGKRRRQDLLTVTSASAYEPQIDNSNFSLKFISVMKNHIEKSRLTSLSTEPYFSEMMNMENSFGIPQHLKLKYLTKGKSQPTSIPLKLMKLKNHGDRKSSTSVTNIFCRYMNETLQYGVKPSLQERENSFRLYDASQSLHPSAYTEDYKSRLEHQLDLHLLDASNSKQNLPRDQGNVGTTGGKREAECFQGTIHKREVHQMPLRKLEKHYVKRLRTNGEGCEDYGGIFSTSSKETYEKDPLNLQDMRRDQVHVAETVVTVLVKDINDNAPVFPNTTMYGEVQENGPIDLSVGVVWAWDADDEQEGTNARLTYSIDKNVIEELSGRPIFTVDPLSGLIRTAICCLDRETTPEYHIQVVAHDGGGLKGTCTVVVRLADVNDNSPRLTRDLWQVEVEETWGEGPPLNHTLLNITASDPDTSNYFFYRVVEESGWGWQHFAMRTEADKGQLFAIKTLDYENVEQRRGFRFMVQVTDRGRGGWGDARHTDEAWVEVRLRDVNDNSPQFARPHSHVTVREDITPGTLLTTLPAIDPDMEGKQGVDYRVLGAWGALTVDGVGGVRLWRALDREAPGGDVGMARVVAMDEGIPPLSATATLTLTVTDVNDCSPRLLPPTQLQVMEGAPASRVGLLTATDDDLWELGHGPPFSFSLAPSNPVYVLTILTLKYDAGADEGRGGAEVWTTGPLDREEQQQVTAEVVLSDAEGLSATYPITIIVGDLNDNPMRPATKTVYLWKTQSGTGEASLGRVYVEDPDDWDLKDKTFAWEGSPHPLFTLQPDTGNIYASTQLREGRYELHFSVSDRVWGQKDVAAKVVVSVRYLSLEALSHAVPLTLTPTTPAALTTGWTPTGNVGGLSTLTEAVMYVVGDSAETVEVVSVYGLPPRDTYLFGTPIRSALPHAKVASDTLLSPSPFVCVWLSVRLRTGGFMNPVKLHGLLGLHLQHLEKIMNVRVTVEDKSNIEDKGEDEVLGSVSLSSNTTPLHKPSSAASLASMALPLQVIDTNSTSLVTPRLMRAHDCHANKYYEDYTCTPASCLNGGRCLKTDVGNRCVCPGGSLGPRCKVVTRTFFGSGWAWLPPLSPCLPATISLRLLTTRPHALILYSGPLATTSNHPRYAPTPMLALQLVDGRPQVLVEGGRGPVKLIVNATLNTGTWHTLHLHLTHQGVMLIVDLCGHGWSADTTSDGHCSARAPWVDPQVIENWSGGVPLQVGGLAHPYPYPEHFGWTNAIVNQALDGCISRLTLNGEVVDVGEPAHSSGSIKGCMPQEKACGQELTFCGIRGSCAGGLIAPRCDCEPGWSGFQCSSPTVPVSLGKASYMKVALPFSQDPYHIMLQLRVRARGHPHGLLMFLPSTHHSSNLKLELRSGVACASMSGPRQGRQEVCLETFPLGDGAWHTVRVGRHGPNLIIGVDDSDGWRQNGSWESFHSSTLHGGTQDLASVAPVPLTVDTVTMGGLPEFVGTTLAKVNHDLQQCCVDDVRVMDHPIALTHDGNTSEWDQSNRHHNLHQGCVAPDVCVNTTCLPPLSCHHPWRETACSCGPGEELVGAGCHDVDECVYQPCLHGGSCINLAPGYHCVCGPAHVGHNCEWTSLTPEPQPLASPLLIVALTLFLLLVVVLGVVVNLRLYRCRATRSKAGVPATPVSVQAASDTCPRTAVEEEVLLETIKVKMPSKHIFSSQGTNHMMPLQGPGSLDDEAVTIKEMSLMIPERVARMTARDEQSEKMANQRRRSIAGVTDVDIHEGIEHKVCLPPTLRSAASHTLPCFTSVCTSTFPTAAFYSSACSTVASSPSVCSAAPCPALYSAVACHNSECATGCPVLVCSKACPASTEFKTNSPEQCPTTLCSTTAYPPASCSIPVCSTAMCPTTSHHTISSKTKCPREISSITESRERVGLRSCSVSSPRPLLAQDDLRAYAYEGEDSVGITPVAELKSFSPRIEKKSLAQFSVNKCTSNV